MRNTNGFINQLLDNTNKFYSISLKQFKFYKKLMGTLVTVDRVKTDSKYKEVFGSIYSSTLLDDADVDRFEYIVLINKNDLLKIYLKNTEELELFDNESILKLGDVISYTRKDQTYRFKIVNVESFSESEGVLNKYILSGIAEVNKLM